MTLIMSEMKRVGDLNIGDFERHPAWTWCENDVDESLVAPIDVTQTISPNEYPAVFILSEFTLNDGATIRGIVSLTSDLDTVYSIELFQGEDSFMFSGSRPAPVTTLEELANWLGKSISQISPVYYRTQFNRNDGQSIEGQIDLEEW
jgi:hypothetical protein